jgi:hypothetical protein
MGNPMSQKQQSVTSTESQSERFKQAARELGCDNSEERFAETVRKLAAAGPQHRPTKELRPAKEPK